jgi:hypothetical protein
MSFVGGIAHGTWITTPQRSRQSGKRYQRALAGTAAKRRMAGLDGENGVVR